jgi:3-hydroxyacyl-CoA dehydrogenase
MKICTVTIIGANGAMGTNISGIFASFGNVKVYMVARKEDDAKKAYERASVSVKAGAISKNLIPVSYDKLPECVAQSDLILESVAEDFDIKKSIYKLINPHIPANAIIASGTSGLSIEALAEQLDPDKRKRFFGVHFFNPPYNLTLCELIPSKYSDTQLSDDLKIYLKNTLFRNVVVVKDTAAFMGNRIGFMFINLAMQYAVRFKGEGGIDYMDSILGGFTGRAMKPLVTADFVGLDVHKAIVDNIYSHTNDYEHEAFLLPAFTQELISENKLGRKTGSGLYASKGQEVYDVATKAYRQKGKYQHPFAVSMIDLIRSGDYALAISSLVRNESQEARLCLELLVRYALYGIYESKTIGEDVHSADKVMASGFNWIPPLCVYNVLNRARKFDEIAYEIVPQEILRGLSLDELLTDIPESEYDYRPFFKAKG